MNKAEQIVVQALLEAKDGLTVKELRKVVKHRSQKEVAELLNGVYGVYIDRWTSGRTGLVPVYCLAEVPDDCPKP